MCAESISTVPKAVTNCHKLLRPGAALSLGQAVQRNCSKFVKASLILSVFAIFMDIEQRFEMDVTMMCLSLLQLLAFPMGTLSSSEVYKRYSGSTAMTGNSLNLTTAPSVVQCLKLCNGYEHMSIKVCDAARHNEGTGKCELMTRKSTGDVQWKVDAQWKVFVSKCEVGWTMFDVSCYQLFRIQENWDAAKYACEQVNASLVSITSEDEDDFINAMLNGISDIIYIGGNKRGIEKQWKWESREVWAYEHFAVGTPDGSVLGIKYNDGWHSVRGMVTYLFYLCEKGKWI